MSSRTNGKRWRPPAMPVALLALFLSLFGTATAAKMLITSKDIKNGTIRLVDINKHTRKQLTAHARRANRATVADFADEAGQAISMEDLASDNTVDVSSNPTPGMLLPLGADGRFPGSVTPNIAARIYNSADEPVAIGSVKTLTFDHVSFDTAHLFDPAHPTRLKAPVAGIYLINANVSWQVATPLDGLNRAVYVYVNGHAISVDQRPPAEETRQAVTTLYRLNAGDEVEVGVAQDEASSLDANAVGDYAPSLSIAWIASG
jgi:hypothetical protein